MHEFVTRANIARFVALIADESDDTKRRSLEQMLVEEKAKLEGLVSGPKDPGAPLGNHPPSEPRSEPGGIEPAR